MDVRHLRQILAVREHGSLAKAAEALGLSQPHLSRSMARLEDQLRVVLFHRTPTGSELTGIGEMVADRAAHLIKETNDLIAEAGMLARGEGGLVRLGVGAALRSTLLPRLLEHIVTRHPQLRIHVEVGAGERLVKHLPGREIDIAFCALRADVTNGDYIYQPIVDGEIVYAASPSHPLAGKPSLARSAITDYPCCGIRSDYFGLQVLLETSDPESRATAYTTNDLEAAVPMAAASSTILIGPSFSLLQAIRSGALVRLDVALTTIVPFGAVTNRTANYSPIVQKIVAYSALLGAEMNREWREVRE